MDTNTSKRTWKPASRCRGSWTVCRKTPSGLRYVFKDVILTSREAAKAYADELNGAL